MQCEKFENRMHQLLDHRQRPEHDPQLQAHAQVCGRCRDTLDYQSVLLEGLVLFHPAEVSDDIAGDIVERAFPAGAKTEEKAARRRRWFWTAGVAAAATLLLAITPFLGQSPNATEMAIRELPARPVTPDPGIDAVGEENALNLQDWLKVAEMADLKGEQIVPKLRPITVFFGVAIDALRRSMPGGRGSPGKPQATLTDWSYSAV